MHSPSGAPRRTQTSRRSLVRREKFASLVAAREFQRPSSSRSRDARTDARQRDGEMRAYLPERRLPREELGFSRFSRQKTENRPSLSGRFACPLWAAPAGRRARLFSHAEAFV